MPEIIESHGPSHVKPVRRPRPESWDDFRWKLKRRWTMPFLFLDWLSQWGAYAMSHVSLFELLEYAGSLSILIAVIFYFIDAPQRTKMKHYQAWQVINSAQGRGGNGGRIEALSELNEDHVSLLGVNVSDAFLQGVQLRGADLSRADMSSADMRRADLSFANLEQANLKFTNLVDATLLNADLNKADLDDADLTGANLEGVKNWRSIRSVQRLTIKNVRNAPPDFIEWAMQRGAIKDEGDLATAPTKAARSE